MTGPIRIDLRDVPARGIAAWEPTGPTVERTFYYGDAPALHSPGLNLRGTIRQDHRLLQCQVGETFAVTVEQADGTDAEREVAVLAREDRENVVFLGLRMALENGTPVDITIEIERPPSR